MKNIAKVEKCDLSIKNIVTKIQKSFIKVQKSLINSFLTKLKLEKSERKININSCFHQFDLHYN